MLESVERPAGGEPQGILVLSHGRGSHEGDLIGLADILDPEGRLLVVAPRAPLQLPGQPGYHWYIVPQVGYPDPETFTAAKQALADFQDDLWERTGLGPAQTLLGGFSMGSVMSFALGLDAERPAPAGLLCFSGFIPTVEGWQPSFSDRATLPAFIAHGAYDPVIPVEYSQIAQRKLVAAGLPVEYHEFAGDHTIDLAVLPAAAEFANQALFG
ncbi:MAG: alpha/beta hydrolase [Solirubrobacterales bacterium]